MTVETILRNMRTDAGLTLGDLANAAKISSPGYFQIEVGQRSAPAPVAQAIADRLGVSVDAIFVPITFAVRKIEGEAHGSQV